MILHWIPLWEWLSSEDGHLLQGHTVSPLASCMEWMNGGCSTWEHTAWLPCLKAGLQFWRSHVWSELPWDHIKAPFLSGGSRENPFPSFPATNGDPQSLAFGLLLNVFKYRDSESDPLHIVSLCPDSCLHLAYLRTLVTVLGLCR
jgi:hypothetical protein